MKDLTKIEEDVALRNFSIRVTLTLIEANVRQVAKEIQLMSSDFSKNLRHLCAEQASIAQICREIELNRQQFNRYLAGKGMPSAHTLRKICRYFRLSEQEISEPHDQFVGRRQSKSQAPIKSILEPLTSAFPGQLNTLRRFLGFYHSHYITPSWDGMILRSLIWLYEENGYVVTRNYERAVSAASGERMNIGYDGLAAFRGNRIFLVERERGPQGSLTETILFPAHRQQLVYLRGMTFGVAWRPRSAPFSSRVIYKRVRNQVPLRAAMEACGAFNQDSRHIDSTVREFLSVEGNGGDPARWTEDYY